MTTSIENDLEAPLRVLLAVASYGTTNDGYLHQIISEYRAMPFDVDILVLSNIDKNLGPGIECLVGLPSKDPWSLPFGHKKLFAERANSYDLFVYSEDDILITETNIRAFLDVTKVLPQQEVAGFLRIEKDTTGERYFPDLHGYFHWDPTSVRSRGQYTLAHFTNEHAACYILTQKQLKTAIESGGFLVGPHEEKYDLLCTAATDPYTQCGMVKLIPVSRIDDFVVHHLSNKYVGQVGVHASEMKTQLEAMARVAGKQSAPAPLLNTETKLPHALYSKDYYEPVNSDVISAIPKTARNVLSIGCGWGATERALIEQGLRVVAVPLDPVISGSAAAQGVEMIYGSLDEIATLLRGEKFDCLLCLNVLHLADEPATVLSQLSDCLALNSAVIIQSPNMMSLRAVREASGRFANQPFGRNYSSTGAHFSSVGRVKNWCSASGMKINRTKGIFDRPEVSTLGRISAAIGDFLPASLAFLLAPSFVISASRVQVEYNQVGTAEFPRSHT
jgi:2-polyprenyl-3-methyl-5-hydroxy-6-metoxy-1,4-benzoquinol methylase